MVTSIQSVAAMAVLTDGGQDDEFQIENGILLNYSGAGGRVVIPEEVTAIGMRAFAGSGGNLTEVVIPNTVKSIGYRAFAGTGLTEITIPESVASIGDAALRADSLKEITVSPKNQSFTSQDGVLFNKDRTTLIEYPSASTRTGYTIPQSVINVGDAFHSSKNLASITITSNVSNMAGSAFFNNPALTSINVADDNQRFSSENGILFDKAKRVLVRYPEGRRGAYSIPSSVTFIGERAFLNCRNLTDVTVPASVRRIGAGAFQLCTGLKEIEIPQAVTEINNFVFEQSGLEEITISDNVVKVGMGAFADSENLKTIVIGENVEEIEVGAFAGSKNLETVTFRTATPPDLGTKSFFVRDNNAKVYVRSDAKVAFKAQEELSGFDLVGVEMDICGKCNRLSCDCSVVVYTGASGQPTMTDALEILRFLAGMPSIYTGRSDAPSVADALEILKFLAGFGDRIDSDFKEKATKGAKDSKETAR
jgi:hypothetical protein